MIRCQVCCRPPPSLVVLHHFYPPFPPLPTSNNHTRPSLRTHTCSLSLPPLGLGCYTQLKGVTEKVRQTLDKNGFPKTTPIIPTSAKSRQGRVELLGYLRLVFDVDRRKGKGAGGAQEEWEGALQPRGPRKQR